MQKKKEIQIIQAFEFNGWVWGLGSDSTIYKYNFCTKTWNQSGDKD